MSEMEQKSEGEISKQPEELSSEKKFRRSVFEWTETIVMAIVLVALMFTFVIRVITVDGGSMKPTYHDGDRVLVSGFAGDIQKGDVVIIVNTLKEPIIKRVIATEGQIVDFDAALGEVTVDGVPVMGDEFGISNGITTLPEYANILEFPQTVPENCVFVLGDNRGNSTDSRFADVGMVDHRNILGKVVFNLYPFSQIGTVG